MFYLFSILTAPGVAVHELGHLFFCWLARVKIYKIKLFQFNKKTAGFVTHAEPRYFFQALFISFGPLFINSLLALLLFARVSHNPSEWLSVFRFNGNHSIIWLWLGIVIALHAIPSNGDAASLFQISTTRWWRNPLRLIGLPFVLFLRILNWLKLLKIDFIYALVLFWLGNIFLKK